MTRFGCGDAVNSDATLKKKDGLLNKTPLLDTNGGWPQAMSSERRRWVDEDLSGRRSRKIYPHDGDRWVQGDRRVLATQERGK
ncbi:hypothetical protein VTN31DRAFT_3424 [Thermomyces dupontii]|uniref:uncharacterized protein n=1 Tax=Talaromyces thermophilus TaxID=28565 RepID=UPI003743621C